MANANSYYLYQKYEKRGNQPWIPLNIYSVDADGTMPPVVKQQSDPDCNLETRWVVAVDEYECSGTTKMTKEKEQQCADGVTWVDTGNHRAALPVLEYQSADCGYESLVKFLLTLNDSSVITGTCSGDASWLISKNEVSQYSATTVNAVITGNCAYEIGTQAFRGFSNLETVDIGSNIEYIDDGAFMSCGSLRSVTVRDTTPPELGNDAFASSNLQTIKVPQDSVDVYKVTSGWSDFANIIESI